MIGVALVIEPQLDLATFAPLSQRLTGVNHVAKADARDLEGLQHVLHVMGSFGRTFPDHIIHLGFLVAGHEADIGLLIEGTGMPHICCECPRGARACLIVGSLSQWIETVKWGCASGVSQEVRLACNQIYGLLRDRGIQFESRTTEQSDGTFLLQ